MKRYSVENRPSRPRLVGVVVCAFIAGCAAVGALAVVEIATRKWPTGGAA